MLSPVQQSC